MLGRPDAAAIERAVVLERELEAFFSTHYDRLVRLAGLICHAASTTEDAVQAAMEQAWRRRATLRDSTRIRPWLDQIVVREAIRVNEQPWWSRFSRRSSVRQIQPVAIDADDAEDGALGRRGAGPVAPSDAAWLALTVAFRRLPIEQRAVVALHLYAGYSVEETAKLTGARVETTRSRLRLARERLRGELGEDARGAAGRSRLATRCSTVRSEPRCSARPTVWPPPSRGRTSRSVALPSASPDAGRAAARGSGARSDRHGAPWRGSCSC